jgi:hypothetical protein
VSKCCYLNSYYGVLHEKVLGKFEIMEGPIIKGESFKEIIIMEHTHFKTVDDLARFANIAVGGKTTGVYWANGVVFVYYPLPTSTEIAAKALIEEKRVFWAFVSYALMPEYRPIIETKERIIVPVIDMTTSPLFQKVAQWLKEQP